MFRGRLFGFVAFLGVLFLLSCEAGTTDSKIVEYIAESRLAVKKMVPPSKTGQQDIGIKKAYELQEALYERLTTHLGRPSGFKLAYASKAAQEAGGVSEPIYGRVFASQRVDDGGKVYLSEYNDLQIEAEVVFLVSQNIDKRLESVGELKSYIRSVHIGYDINNACFELSKGKPALVDIIASGVGAQNYALGPAIDPSIDLDNLTLKIMHEGQNVYEGNTSALMGSPWNALLWLSQKLVEDGKMIKAGDVVFSGALAKPYGGEKKQLKGEYVADCPELEQLTVIVE